jgi:hypothetical protein
MINFIFIKPVNIKAALTKTHKYQSLYWLSAVHQKCIKTAEIKRLCWRNASYRTSSITDTLQAWMSWFEIKSEEQNHRYEMTCWIPRDWLLFRKVLDVIWYLTVEHLTNLSISHNHWDLKIFQPYLTEITNESESFHPRKISMIPAETPEAETGYASCCFLLGLFVDPEDGGNMFLRNVSWLPADYTALHPRRYGSSVFVFVIYTRKYMCHII